MSDMDDNKFAWGVGNLITIAGYGVTVLATVISVIKNRKLPNQDFVVKAVVYPVVAGLVSGFVTKMTTIIANDPGIQQNIKNQAKNYKGIDYNEINRKNNEDINKYWHNQKVRSDLNRNGYSNQTYRS